MQVQQLSVKFFLENGAAIDTDQLISIFHRWIRDRILGDEVLIDVADYRHVPQGPGVMMVAHEGHYAMDEGGGGIGLSYSVKRDPMGTAQERFPRVFERVLNACSLLEKEESLPGLNFDGARVQVQVLSRLAAGNSESEFAALQSELQKFLPRLYESALLDVQHFDADAKSPLGAWVTVGSDVGVSTLLERLST